MTQEQIATSFPGMSTKEVLSCISALVQLVSETLLGLITYVDGKVQKLLATEKPKDKDAAVIFHGITASAAKEYVLGLTCVSAR